MKLTLGTLPIFLAALLLPGFGAFNPPAIADEVDNNYILQAKWLFDGRELQTDVAVVVKNDRIEHVGKVEPADLKRAKVIDFGDSTLLPGFIESHAHVGYRRVPHDVVLRHGVTTLRDMGGPVHKTVEGNGRLRVLTSGPILTAPGGYPIPLMGEKDIAIAVESEQQARHVVKKLIAEGAELIKIALEPGGEPGAPWASHSHGHGGGHHAGTAGKNRRLWPMLPLSVVKTIVEEAHRQGKRVSAHVGESSGALIALDANVDEWSHTPCGSIPEALLKRAARQNVTIVSTIDTLSACPAVRRNIHLLERNGATIVYGAEIAHPDIPWGIDAQELILLLHNSGLSVVEVLMSATSLAAQNIGRPDLGVIEKGAVADLIAVKGNLMSNLKSLEHPGFVMSGGVVVVNHFH